MELRHLDGLYAYFVVVDGKQFNSHAFGREGGPRGTREKNLQKTDSVNHIFQQHKNEQLTYDALARIKR
jgi:hypothetical protein